MSIDNGIEASSAGHVQGRRWRRSQALRWAVFRLVALWVPVALVLALALWTVLFYTLAPWGYRWQDDNPPAFDALPSQLLFAALLLLAGRFEAARLTGSEASSAAIRSYWWLSTLLIVLGVAVFREMALTQPVLQ